MRQSTVRVGLATSINFIAKRDIFERYPRVKVNMTHENGHVVFHLTPSENGGYSWSNYGTGDEKRFTACRHLISGISNNSPIFGVTVAESVVADDDGVHITMPKVLRPRANRSLKSPKSLAALGNATTETVQPPAPVISTSCERNLALLVRDINIVKQELGECLQFSIKDDGRLSVLVEYL